ncbi:MAG: serine--tRNA ligase, partial [Chitinophagaceae bacterium]|nr:serine--tRNA ligase [Chitinophagaceae bacterium]
MLQINYLRQNPEDVKHRLGVRNFSKIHLVDELLQLDVELRRQKAESENL